MAVRVPAGRRPRRLVRLRGEWESASSVCRALRSAGWSATGHLWPVEKLRRRRPDRRHYGAASLPWDRADTAAASTTALAWGDVVAGPFDPVGFVLGLRVFRLSRPTRPRRPRRRDPVAARRRQRARAFDRRRRIRLRTHPPRILQSGPRRLWDEVEAAWLWWDGQGRPTVHDFGLTATITTTDDRTVDTAVVEQLAWYRDRNHPLVPPDTGNTPPARHTEFLCAGAYRRTRRPPTGAGSSKAPNVPPSSSQAFEDDTKDGVQGSVVAGYAGGVLAGRGQERVAGDLGIELPACHRVDHGTHGGQHRAVNGEPAACKGVRSRRDVQQGAWRDFGGVVVATCAPCAGGPGVALSGRWNYFVGDRGAGDQEVGRVPRSRLARYVEFFRAHARRQAGEDVTELGAGLHPDGQGGGQAVEESACGGERGHRGAARAVRDRDAACPAGASAPKATWTRSCLRSAHACTAAVSCSLPAGGQKCQCLAPPARAFPRRARSSAAR